MNSYVATTTFGSSGTYALTTGFSGKLVELKASGYFGGTDPTAHTSLGWSDGVRQNCDSTFADGSLHSSKKVTNKLLSLWENQSGVLVEVLSISFNSFTATQVLFNVTIGNPSYQVSIKVLG